ncbi:MAG: hypothetical protein GC157_01175 [Frankiales bacterium]|nr:hypothetical protein [Frankiales bacterium]
MSDPDTYTAHARALYGLLLPAALEAGHTDDRATRRYVVSVAAPALVVDSLRGVDDYGTGPGEPDSIVAQQIAARASNLRAAVAGAWIQEVSR